MARVDLICLWIGVAIAASTGCRTFAPMQVWRSPQVIPTTPQRIALGPIGGDPEIAERLHQEILLNRNSANQKIAVLDPPALERETAVQLSSHVERSDIASLNAAKRANTEYLLEAEVIHSDLVERDPRDKKSPPESMTVHCKIIEVATGQKLGESTILMDRKTAEKRYPDLEWTGGSASDRVIKGVARASWETIGPHLQKEKVYLATPWISLGAGTVRKGNAHAKQGRWDLAEREWQTAVSLHPSSKAGWHNLSLAAVAKEDFDLAKSRMEHANSWVPWDPSDSSSIWIERQQQAFHTAFQLPPPKEGWTVPTPPTLKTMEVQSTSPVEIEDLPWWTALPFAKPPGWTWRSWFSQPLTFH